MGFRLSLIDIGCLRLVYDDELCFLLVDLFRESLLNVVSVRLRFNDWGGERLILNFIDFILQLGILIGISLVRCISRIFGRSGIIGDMRIGKFLLRLKINLFLCFQIIE